MCIRDRYDGKWDATGKQFQIPYVFKKLFSKEPIEFEDMCEPKEVKSALYLHFEDDDDYRFIGRVGQFCPVKPGCGGGLLLRQDKDKNGDPKYNAVVGTKGYYWLESEMVRELGKEDDIDKSYYDNLVNDAVESISQFGDFEWFVSED